VILALLPLILVVGCGDDTTTTADDTGTATATADDTGTSTTSVEDTGTTPDTEPPTDDTDADADGHPASTDCDDDDPAVNPGADETCDHVDNDCDGAVDEDSATDAPTWYGDDDSDGWGETEDSTTACSAPHGYVAGDGDCDDEDPRYHPGAAEEDCTDSHDYNCDGSVGYADADTDGVAACEDCDDASAYHYPGAPERCEGTDEDCDGDVDEDAIDTTTFYADSDGDGHGGDRFTAESCEAPDGYVETAEDCDDLDPAVNPDASETCNGIDDDCDDLIDDDDAAVSGRDTWYLDADGDGYGVLTSTTQACELPDGYADNANDCDDDDATLSPDTVWYADFDGDGAGNPTYTTTSCETPSGYVDDDDDCDDLDATSYPGADELCDGADNDCDGSAETLDSYYLDQDGDGYGDARFTTQDCETPSGYTDNGDDCDDLAASAYPGADEVCDGIDNNCDGDTDGSDALDPTTWYEDGDGDGYGDPDAATDACDAPSDHVADDQDCDDGDAAVSPDAEELCNSVDDDCNGETDEPGATDGDTYWEDLDGDGYGGLTGSITACSQPSGYGTDADDCDDFDFDVNPGASETCSGTDSDCDGSVDEGAYGQDAACAGLSCQDILDNDPTAGDGRYWIEPDGAGSYETVCDMTFDGGGWTLAILGTLDGSYDGSFGATPDDTKGFMESMDRLDMEDILVKMGSPETSTDWVSFHNVGTGTRSLDDEIHDCCTGSYDVDYGVNAPHEVYDQSSSLNGVDEARLLSLRMSHTAGPNDAFFFSVTGSHCGSGSDSGLRSVSADCFSTMLGFWESGYDWPSWETTTSWDTSCSTAGYWGGGTSSCTETGGVFVR